MLPLETPINAVCLLKCFKVSYQPAFFLFSYFSNWVIVNLFCSRLPPAFLFPVPSQHQLSLTEVLLLQSPLNSSKNFPLFQFHPPLAYYNFGYHSHFRPRTMTKTEPATSIEASLGVPFGSGNERESGNLYFFFAA